MGAIALGLCNVAVIAYGSTQRSVGRKQASVREINPYETPFKPFMPSSAYALAASRHMHQFGTTREQLAAVAVAAREWALLNPGGVGEEAADDRGRAVLPHGELSLHGARLLSGHRRRRRHRRHLGRARQVAQEAAGLRAGLRPVDHARQHLQHARPDGDRGAGSRQGRLPDGQARRRRRRCCELYDAFTINTILFLEDLGFCKKGEGGAFVSGGRIAPKGSLAVNTNGGGLSYCHPGMYGLFLLIEAVRQLRGECGARQVKDCEVAIAHGNGGVLSSQATVILGTQATL